MRVLLSCTCAALCCSMLQLTATAAPARAVHGRQACCCLARSTSRSSACVLALIPAAPPHMPTCYRVVLFLAGVDSSACMIGLDRGESIGRAMKPKNASRPLAMALLDAAGCPLPLLHGGLVLHWANNNSAATVRSLAMTKVASIREEPGQASSRSLGRLRYAVDGEQCWNKAVTGGVGWQAVEGW